MNYIQLCHETNLIKEGKKIENLNLKETCQSGYSKVVHPNPMYPLSE